jgi:hypothetical protein
VAQEAKKQILLTVRFDLSSVASRTDSAVELGDEVEEDEELWELLEERTG